MDEREGRVARFLQRIGQREARKLRGRREVEGRLWFELGMYGLVGWSVAVPTLAAIALGAWLDGAYPGRISWTLTLLFVGLVTGCWTAWYWISREQHAIGRRDEGPSASRDPPEASDDHG